MTPPNQKLSGEDFFREYCQSVLEVVKERDELREALEDKRRLTRELDVAMHGEEGAAKQASLCDLISPAKNLRTENTELREHVAVLRKIVEQCLHARQCNAPYGQTEKYPSVTQFKEALNSDAVKKASEKL